MKTAIAFTLFLAITMDVGGALSARACEDHPPGGSASSGGGSQQTSYSQASAPMISRGVSPSRDSFTSGFFTTTESTTTTDQTGNSNNQAPPEEGPRSPSGRRYAD